MTATQQAKYTWFTYRVEFTQSEIPDRTFRFTVPTASAADENIAAEQTLAEKVERHVRPHFPDHGPLKALISPWGDVVVKHYDTEIVHGTLVLTRG